MHTLNGVDPSAYVQPAAHVRSPPGVKKLPNGWTLTSTCPSGGRPDSLDYMHIMIKEMISRSGVHARLE